MCTSIGIHTAGLSIVLADATGETFDYGMALNHEQPIKHELIQRIEPTKAPRRHRATPCRRVRRANTGKGTCERGGSEQDGHHLR